jgi:DNA-binding protein YbaB
MFDDQLAALAALRDDGDALLRRTRSAARAAGEPGSDSTGSVMVTLNEHGRVATMVVARDWRTHLTNEQLGAAVVAAVRDASMRRVGTWSGTHSAAAEEGFQNRLDSIISGPLSEAEREAALVVLLEVAESIEQGLDEVCGSLQQTLSTIHTGVSPHREVIVELTGGGDVTAVRFDRCWLRDAHEANLAQQVVAAFETAYELVAAHGVQRLIADSPLGEAQRMMQDPFVFARRFRLAG